MPFFGNGNDERPCVVLRIDANPGELKGCVLFRQKIEGVKEKRDSPIGAGGLTSEMESDAQTGYAAICM
jgi:hypothetical protein